MIKYKTSLSSSGKREIHLIIINEDSSLTLRQQTEKITEEYLRFSTAIGANVSPVFMRWFVSDAANQASALPRLAECAVSVVEQAPLNLTKVALWVWFVEGVVVSKREEGFYSVKGAAAHTHLFGTGAHRSGVGAHSATYEMLCSLDNSLRSEATSLLEGCVRTWFFVQNVDVNYSGVVSGRNQAFKELGLTPKTRFIASTGIGGAHADRASVVQLDSYSVSGLLPGQMCQIGAPKFLNPTYEYGVAFERATSVDYSDRRHLFISGTASIDCFGEVVHPGDIRRQTLRMWENVEALLKAAECGWSDVGEMIVYLRDPADHDVVAELFGKCFPDIPFVIVLAPVCRPGWLIEMECMAMRPISSSYPDF